MIKRNKQFISILMATMILISIVPQTTYATLRLSREQMDTPSNWAKADIKVAKSIGFVPSEIQGNYKDSITREEFSELAVGLYETLSRKKVTVQISNPFNDTRNSKAIIANQIGIMSGRGEGKFDPYGEITKEEISVVLYNTLKIAKPNNNYGESLKSGFKDDSKISNWAKDAVGFLYGIEVLNGGGDNLFNPKGQATREEAIILAKLMHEKVSEAERTSRGRLVPTREPEIEEEPAQVEQLKKLLSQEMGKPYKYGATGPNNYDCSGLTYSVFGKLGIKLGRTSRSQINSGTPVSKNDLQYGDLILFARDGKNINHVGIYVGNGKFVHSPQTGDVVKESTLTTGYYSRSYYAARRVLQ